MQHGMHQVAGVPKQGVPAWELPWSPPVCPAICRAAALPTSCPQVDVHLSSY
jgi:hypothetical protein